MLPTEKNYAVNYWRKIFQYIHYRLEEITLVVNGVKSYSLLKTEEIAPIVYGVKSNEYTYIYIYMTEEITPSVTGPGVKSYSM